MKNRVLKLLVQQWSRIKNESEIDSNRHLYYDSLFINFFWQHQYLTFMPLMQDFNYEDIVMRYFFQVLKCADRFFKKVDKRKTRNNEEFLADLLQNLNIVVLSLILNNSSNWIWYNLKQKRFFWIFKKIYVKQKLPSKVNLSWCCEYPSDPHQIITSIFIILS